MYEAESKSQAPSDVIAALPVVPDPYAVALAEGVGEHQTALDTLVARFARGWTVDRMPAIDRAVLRMATYELAHRPDVPTAVAISEAVALAKQFSTEDSGRFVNGLLSRIAEELRGN
ncbi:MAG: transcription antitermination factor NusB [Acidimicrobiales bacterium]